VVFAAAEPVPDASIQSPKTKIMFLF